jgi:hydrogenase/urease accessory protein HupE
MGTSTEAGLRLLAVAFLCASATGAAGPPAAAHGNTVSFPVFTVYEREVGVEVRVKVAYFTDVVRFEAGNVDIKNGGLRAAPPPLTEAAVRARELEMVDWVRRAVAIEANGRALEAAFDGMTLTRAPGEDAAAPPLIDEARFLLRYESAEPIARVAIRYKLFAEHDPMHRGIAKIRAGAAERSLVFRRDTVFEATSDDLRRGGAWRAALSFFLLGMEHIFSGYDHLLFVAGLLLVSSKFRTLLGTVTGFTIAHSITLVSAALGWISLPGSIVEPAIALSIVFVGIENLLRTKEPRRRWLVASAFGLVHGLGFAGFVMEAELPPGAAAVSLAAFNLGVEAGQATVICLAFPILAFLRERLGDARFLRFVVRPLSVLIVAFGLYWTWSRTWGRV